MFRCADVLCITVNKQQDRHSAAVLGASAAVSPHSLSCIDVFIRGKEEEGQQLCLMKSKSWLQHHIFISKIPRLPYLPSPATLYFLLWPSVTQRPKLHLGKSGRGKKAAFECQLCTQIYTESWSNLVILTAKIWGLRKAAGRGVACWRRARWGGVEERKGEEKRRRVR